MRNRSALWRLDAHIEKSKPAHHAKDQAHETRSDDNTSTILAVDKAKDADGPDRSPNLWESSLETSINGLTPTSPSSPLLRRQWLEQCVRSAHAIVLDTEKQQQQQQPALGTADSSSTANTYSHHPREWTLAARATLQTFGHVVTSLVEETISFDEDIAYWDGIVASKYYTVVYTINTAPLRLASWLMNVTRDVRRRIVAKDIEGIRSSILKPLLSLSFHNFYDGLLTTLRHPLFHTQLTLNYFLSPFASARVEARRRRHGLVGLRDSNAEAIGVLLKHGCRYDLENATEHHLKQTSVTSTGLMQTILRKDGVHVNEMTSAAANAEADVEESILSSAKGTYDMLTTACSRVLEGLQEILQTSIRQHHVSLSTQMSQNRFSRPSSLTRLWFPLTAFLLSSRVITTYITQHRVTLSIFIHDAADTVVAFGRNWVVAPCRKLLSIIRHTDAAGSDIALVSKASLQTDRDSLERMVLDFMSDIHDGDATDLDQLRTKVQEGDLTSVLKAYEKDLRRPFVGTFRGGLVRALLIQVQKTKVDIEVAMTGIDALLRSQELVFGYGVALFCVFAFGFQLSLAFWD